MQSIGADKQTIIFNVTLPNLYYKFACKFASMLHQHINDALKIACAVFFFTRFSPLSVLTPLIEKIEKIVPGKRPPVTGPSIFRLSGFKPLHSPCFLVRSKLHIENYEIIMQADCSVRRCFFHIIVTNIERNQSI